MRLSSMLLATLLTGAAVAQVGIPPHASIYNGFSRGFNFTSSIPFIITQLDLPLDAFQAGDTASYLVRVNGATALWSIGNAGPISPGLLINPGDVVDIIGNWSPAATTNFTAHNSYGSTAPYATTIEGVPHTLNRTGWQWDIGAPTWVSTGATGAYLPPTSGSIGRVLVYTAPVAGTIATNTSLGAGCYASYASFYENFATSAAFDLANTAITLVPSGGGGYVVTLGGAFLPVGSIAAPVSLALTDDSQVTVPFTVGSFPGWTGLTVCSNGFVSKAVGNGTGFTPAVATMLAGSQDGFWCWHDYNPAIAGSGQVKVEESAAATVVTWDGVWDFGGTSVSNANNLQFQFYPSGVVTIAWGTMSGLGNGHLVGYSPGGANLDPGNTDISALGAGAIVLGTTDQLPLALAATSRPITGTNWGLNVTNIPATGVIGIDVFGLSDPNIPDLGFLGLPGCGLRSSLELLSSYLVAGSSHAYSLPIPNVPTLVGIDLFTTAAVFQAPPVNAFGAITSNGVKGFIGDV